MSSKEIQDLMDHMKKAVNAGKARLEQNIPRLERNLKTYAGKIGIKPEDIDMAKEKVREKIEELQKKK